MSAGRACSSSIAELRVDGWRLRVAAGAGDPPAEVWREAWPALWGRAERGELRVLKEHHGDVLTGEAGVGDARLDVVVKRPRAASWHKWLADLTRPSKARRTWDRTWAVLETGLPAERPVLLATRRRGVAKQGVFVSRRVPGEVLHTIDLDDAARRRLLRRCGLILRRLEAHGLTHADAKAHNWIVTATPAGPRPVMIDCDSIYPGPPGRGIERLERAVKDRGLGDADVAALRRGYGWGDGR